jgi:acetylornithine deacetylase/succinyl-diaminopimelate desuccinylase-like protein
MTQRRPARTILFCLLSSVIFFSASVLEADDRYPVDWQKTASETLKHIQALLQIDTTNPPGNETRAAQYLQKVLEAEGIPARLLALNPERANLVARIRGNGSRRPVLVMGHTDVVGVEQDKWSEDPFGAVCKEGYIYGRGAVDDKDSVTAYLMLMLLLKRHDVRLDRDIIFLAEAGEETASPEGIRHIISNHWDEIDAEFALAEGGGGMAQDGKARYFTVATTEKIPRGAWLIARGTAGHASVPRPENAVVRLANAITKLTAWNPPMRLSETTQTYFDRLAQVSSPEAAARYRTLLDPNKRGEAEAYLARHEHHHNSMLRTSISPTLLKAGMKSNVIPSEAEAFLDIRALPDEDMGKFIERMREVIGDPNVQIKINRGRKSGPPSRLDSEMFQGLEKTQKRLAREAATLPTMTTGASDLSPLRLKGVQAYGIGPLLDQKDFRLGHGSHSDDERISERSLRDFVRFLWHAVIEVAGSR